MNIKYFCWDKKIECNGPKKNDTKCFSCAYTDYPNREKYELDDQKGLSYEELNILLKYIEREHSVKNLHNDNDLNRTPFYVEFRMDTRTCDIWFVRFHNVINYNDETVVFRTEEGYSLKHKMYEWLNSKEKKEKNVDELPSSTIPKKKNHPIILDEQ